MKKSLLFLMFIISLSSDVYAVGSPDYLPDGNHPRIWLTATELAKLNAKQVANAAEVETLLDWCDAHINDTIDSYGRDYDDGNVNWSGYRGSGYMTFLLNFSLGYQILKDDNPTKALTYAQLVRDILIDGVYTSMSAGDELNGLALLRCGETSDRTINADENVALGLTYASYKLGYSNRMIASVPIAYDWIHESGVLTTSEKTALSSMMYRWVDWTRGIRSTHNNGVLVGSTRYFEDNDGDCSGDNNCTTNTVTTSMKASAYGVMIGNFMGGHAFLINMVPLATYGDHADAGNYLAVSKDLIENTIKDQYGDPLQHAGGDSTEGWNYGSSFWSVLQGLYGHYTATGENIFSDFNWPLEIVEAMAHRSQSDLLHVPIYGDWTGLPLGEQRPYQMIPLIGISQRIFPAEPINQVGQYMLENAPFSTGNIDAWSEALWYDNDFTATPPTTLSLSHVTSGHGFVTSRSTWNDADDTVHFSLRLEGKITNSHEDYDEGTFTVMRGEDRLLTHQNMQGDSKTTNMVVFNDLSHHASNYAQTELAIDRYHEGVAYMYVSGDITNAWKRKYNDNRAELVRRSALHIRPDVIVVYDITESNSVVGNQKDLYTQYMVDPDVSGQTITATNGTSRAFVKTLYPAGSFTESNPATGFYRVKFTPTIQKEYEQFLQVIETGSNIDSQTTTTLISGTNCRGALIGQTAAVFTDSPAGESIGTAEYTTSATTHYVADLPTNTDITVERAGTEIAISPINSGDAGIIEFTTSSGEIEYTVTAGDYVPPVCGPDTLSACTIDDCASVGGGYWYDSTCNVSPQQTATTRHHLPFFFRTN